MLLLPSALATLVDVARCPVRRNAARVARLRDALEDRALLPIGSHAVETALHGAWLLLALSCGREAFVVYSDVDRVPDPHIDGLHWIQADALHAPMAWAGMGDVRVDPGYWPRARLDVALLQRVAARGFRPPSSTMLSPPHPPCRACGASAPAPRRTRDETPD